MSKGSKIRIDDATIDIYLSTKAMLDISELMDKPFEELNDWLIPEGGISPDIQLSRICDVIGILANAAIYRHNSQVRMNLISGEIKEFYNIADFRNVLDPFKMDYYFKAITECLKKDNAVVIPDGYVSAEEDEVLKEIEEAKNHSAGDAVTAS